MKLIALGFLTTTSFSDIKNKMINIYTIAVYSAIVSMLIFADIMICNTFGDRLSNYPYLYMFNNIFVYNISFTSAISGLVVGITLLIISKITKGELGEGDAYVAMVLGLMIGLIKVYMVFMIAFMMAAIFSTIKLKVSKGKYSGKDTVPFIPFVLAAYVLCLWYIV